MTEHNRQKTCRLHRPRRHGGAHGRTPGEGRPRGDGVQPHPSRADAWVEKHGGRAAATPAEAAAGAELVFACVGNDDDVRAVTTGADGAFAGMGKGAVFVDHTTASADLARELAAEAAQRGFGFLDAPVSGGQAGAENGQLTVMVGGEPTAFARAEPVMRAYGRAVTLMGPAGAGQLTKMVNQICIAGLVQGLAEGLDFGLRAGPRHGPRARRHLQGRGPVVADGEPRLHHDPRPVRFRLRGRLDAQGPRHLHGGGRAQRRERRAWRRWSTGSTARSRPWAAAAGIPRA